MKDICTVALKNEEMCALPAIIMLKDLKAQGKTKKLFMCEDHFNMFCKSLIENDIPYGKPAPTSTKR